MISPTFTKRILTNCVVGQHTIFTVQIHTRPKDVLANTYVQCFPNHKKSLYNFRPGYQQFQNYVKNHSSK
jgi:hypothetical protein